MAHPRWTGPETVPLLASDRRHRQDPGMTVMLVLAPLTLTETADPTSEHPVDTLPSSQPLRSAISWPG